MSTGSTGQILQSRVATCYQHTQAVPATVWTINHGLYDYPIIDVYITVDGNLSRVIPFGISYVNNTTAVVTFQSARAGIAMVV